MANNFEPCLLCCFMLILSVTGDHVRQGKPNHLHDGHLRYGAVQPYVENTCGFPQWVVSFPGDDIPDRALIAAKDSQICDGTVCGKDIYVSMFNVDGGVSVGKTWFTRSDGVCASAAQHDEVVSGDSCRILTMGAAAHDKVRFAWTKVEANGNSRNRYTAPPHAMIAGNDPDTHGPVHICRFVNEFGDYLIGQTWFPRHDESCCTAEFGGNVLKGKSCEILAQVPC